MIKRCMTYIDERWRSWLRILSGISTRAPKKERIAGGAKSAINAWGRAEYNSIPVIKDPSVFAAISRRVNNLSGKISFKDAQGWVNYAIVMGLKWGGRGYYNTKRAVEEDRGEALVTSLTESGLYNVNICPVAAFIVQLRFLLKVWDI